MVGNTRNLVLEYIFTTLSQLEMSKGNSQHTKFVFTRNYDTDLPTWLNQQSLLLLVVLACTETICFDLNTSLDETSIIVVVIFFKEKTFSSPCRETEQRRRQPIPFFIY